MVDEDRDPTIATRYLAALQVDPGPPSLPLLQEIVRRHVDALPFSSIGPRLGDPLPIDPASLLDRLVVRRRGGYCFEQNGLNYAVLEDLGFDARIQMARVVLDQDIHPGLTHRVTRAVVDGREFVVDVGFGPMGPPVPVPMSGDEVAASVGGSVRYRVHRRESGGLAMQRLADGDWFTLYRFDDVPYGQSDAELGHFYSHRHPEAVFVNNLAASRIRADEVRSLRNGEYWVIRESGTSAESIPDAQRLHALLTGELGLSVTPEESERLWSELTPEPDAH